MDNDMKPAAYRIQWANGEVDFLTYIPKGESGVYACEPLYTRPPEPRDAARYTWLCNQWMNGLSPDVLSAVERAETFAEMDELIDAAMAQEGK